MLTVNDVSVQMGPWRLFGPLSFQVAPGEVLALTGPNGVGKTTLLDTICGWRRRRSGRVEVDGIRVESMAPWERFRRGIGRTLQAPSGLTSLSVEENLSLIENLRSPRRPATTTFWHSRFDTVLERFDLQSLRAKPFGYLSGGQKKLVSVGRALISGGRVFLLDEPFAGLERAAISAVCTMIVEARQEGVGFVLVDHDFESLCRVSNRLIVLGFPGQSVGELTGSDVSVEAVTRLQATT